MMPTGISRYPLLFRTIYYWPSVETAAAEAVFWSALRGTNRAFEVIASLLSMKYFAKAATSAFAAAVLLT